VSNEVLMAIAVTAELTGTELSAAALRVMDDDLKGYPEVNVLRALERCRKELTGRLTLSAIIDRLNEDDGRPTGDEAWSLAIGATDEAETVVWSDEMQQAFAIARPVLDCGDKVGARMAFRDAYERIVRQNREVSRKPVWSASLGWDKGRRIEALAKAERIGLLPSTTVAALMPPSADVLPLSGLVALAALPAPGVVDDGLARRRLEELKSIIGRPTAKAEDAGRSELVEKKRRIAETVRARLAEAS
jgi:hypothetical protein